MASFGVTYLSKEALRDARRFMHAEQAGVRDEVGFLIIHQRYADRFFPGTSVLHTRLRYVLFIPWIYADVRNSRRQRRDPADAIARGEHKLTKRLLGQHGVIGGRVFPKSLEQPPSYVYWTALQAWGLLRQRDVRGTWSRNRVEELLATPSTGKLSDDDGLPIDQTDWPFAGYPSPPKNWSSNKTLSFNLRKRERAYLARQLRHVDSPVSSGEPSLLALLVGKPLDAADYAWSPEIADMARHEQAALVRAGQAAALAAIGRAIYAAQVETLKGQLDRRECSDLQRNALAGVVAKWRAEAAELDWPSFIADMDTLPPRVSEALQETLCWVRRGKKDPMIIEPAYRHSEEARKGRRARLSRTQDGRDRRTEWDNEKHGAAEPLHYRWGNVKRLLRDLEGVR